MQNTENQISISSIEFDTAVLKIYFIRVSSRDKNPEIIYSHKNT